MDQQTAQVADPAQTYEIDQYQNPEEVYPEEDYVEEQPEENDFEVEYGEKSKRPHGNKRKEKYQGKHQDQYDGNEDGYYDELGFYYMPDGSFYDPDGYYFNIEGYDKFGGYYDDNAAYVPPEDSYAHNSFQGKSKGETYVEEEDATDDKYTKEFIEYITESKYYDDLEYLKSTAHKWAYLKVGNLAEGTIKTDLLKYFGNQGIETKEITIMMSGGKHSPIGNLEIYKIPVAIQVLKLWGQEFGKKKVIIEVDQENEKAYNGYLGDSYNSYEYEDETDTRYTKYDSKAPEGEDAVEAAPEELK